MNEANLPPGQLRWRFAKVELDEAQLRLSVNSEVREIEPRPLQALMFFLRHAGEVVTKDELLENLWPGRIVTEASLTVCVAKLRQALGDQDQSLIRTVHGYGYRLAVPVSVETYIAPAPALASLRLTEGVSLPQRPNWRLMRRLGAGGYGEAWLCEQTKTHEQRVFKFSSDGAQLSALKREVTLFRLLNDELGERPDLLRLLDWNFEAAPFFIELEYCPEGSLAQWAQAQGAIGQIALAQRLDLFVQIADCVAAAHSLGVLHKDLKPSNILMVKDASGAPQAKVTDWGSGWLLDAERLHKAGITRLGFTQAATKSSDSGTAMYQPPEVQAGQPATVQGDIYALGVLLYQLVIGDFTRALASGWEHDVIDPLLREDIADAADGDLHRRLGDVAELAQRIRSLDVRRAERERRAQEQEQTQRVQEQIKTLRLRRRWAWAVAGTFLAGFAISTVLYLDARRATRQATAISDFLTEDLLSSANPMLAASADAKVSEVLDAAAAALNHRFAAQPETLLSLQTVLGSAYANLIIRDKALALLNPALESAISRHGHDSAEAQSVRKALLDLYSGERDLQATRKITEVALAVERANGNADSVFAIDLEQARATVLCWTEGYAACVEPMRAVTERAERVFGRADVMAAEYTVIYASVLAGVGRKDEALALTQEGVQRLRKALGPDHPRVLLKTVYIGYILQKSGRAAEAIPILESLVPKIEKIFGAASHDAWQLRKILALSYSSAGRAAEALPILERIYQERVQQFSAADADAQWVRMYRALALHRVGKTAQAREEVEALMALQQQQKEPDADLKVELLRLRQEFRAASATPP